MGWIYLFKADIMILNFKTDLDNVRIKNVGIYMLLGTVARSIIKGWCWVGEMGSKKEHLGAGDDWSGNSGRSLFGVQSMVQNDEVHLKRIGGKKKKIIRREEVKKPSIQTNV